MKKFILVTVLLVFTWGLTACRDNNDDYDGDGNNNGYDYEVNEDEALYEEDDDTASDNQQLSDEEQRPESPEISLERAIEIAYEDLENRGISATFREDSGMEWEQGQWVWELLFATEGESMPFVEYYINVDDGSIVKFEWDD